MIPIAFGLTCIIIIYLSLKKDEEKKIHNKIQKSDKQEIEKIKSNPEKYSKKRNKIDTIIEKIKNIDSQNIISIKSENRRTAFDYEEYQRTTINYHRQNADFTLILLANLPGIDLEIMWRDSQNNSKGLKFSSIEDYEVNNIVIDCKKIIINN